MELFEAVFGWFGANEAVLSGIAACIVILGVAYRPIRQLVQRRRSQDNDEPTEEEKPALVTDRPSIAVMPFANRSADAEQDFLADGLTEDVILGLSRVKQLFVIARNTSFTYKGRVVDASEISKDLGVRYVLEGSVRPGGGRVRVSAQLVDATTRASVWSEHFDRPVEEITEVDDEVTEAILAALLPALRRAEAEHARRSAPEDLTAWALVNRAWVSLQSDLGDRETVARAAEACREALLLDPDYAFADAALALALSLLSGELGDPEEPRQQAYRAIERALELAPDDPLVHHCHAALLGNFGRTEDGIRAWRRAIELDPNSAGARAGLGIALIYIRDVEAALGHIDQAIRRSPRDPLAYHWLSHRGLALSLLGRIEEALEVSEQSIDLRPSRVALAVLAGLHAERGELPRAAAAWQTLRERLPSLLVDDLVRLAAALAPDPQRAQQIEAALRAAAEAAASDDAASALSP